MSSVSGLEFEARGIGAVLKEYELVVPLYQRSYAWTEDNINELFSDIGSAIQEREKEYFLGSIVLTKQTGKGSKRFDVVDGQQRLATASILIAAIRDYLITMQQDGTADSIESEMLFHRDRRTQETLPRLRLNEFDHEFFDKTVLSRPADRKEKVAVERDSHKRLSKASKIAKTRVEIIANYGSDKASSLNDWLDYIEENVKVIVVKAPDDANAFSIFETLNDRGLELAVSDLLKNFLLAKADDRLEEARKCWMSVVSIMEAITGEGLMTTFIRHSWSSRWGLTRERELYRAIRLRIQSKQSAIEFAGDLESDAFLYLTLFNPHHDYWKKFGGTASQLIESLLSISLQQNRPLLIAILNKFEDKEVLKSLRLILDSAVRTTVAGTLGASKLENGYSETAKDVSKGIIKNATQLRERLQQFVPDDTEFKLAFSQFSVSRADLARFYLRELEKFAQNGELTPVNNQNLVNLEHVLPLNPDGHWNHISDEDKDRCVRRLGNLALLGPNENCFIGNGSFQVKKEHLEKSCFSLTRNIGEFKNWSSVEINQRQEMLSDIAVKLWSMTV